MQPTQVAISLAALGFLAATLAGLHWRGRARRVRLLPIQLAVTGIADLFVLLAPSLFRVWRVWIARELLVLALTLAVVLEVAWRVFAALPRAAVRVRLALAAVLGWAALSLVLVPWYGIELVGTPWTYVVVTEALPRLAYATLWLCVAVIVVMNMHGVPPDPLHRAVLGGLAAYLLIYSVGLGLQRGPYNGAVVYTLTPLAYVSLLAYWSRVAWRAEVSPPGAEPEAVGRLQPWK